MAKLVELPPELLEQILLYLGQPAYHSLSQVSRSLCDIVTPHLYRDINLLARADGHTPRIDRLFFNILNEPRLGQHVRSLQLGVKSDAPVLDFRRCLAPERKAQHQLHVTKAMKFIDTWQPLVHVDDFQEGLETNDYGAYAALLFLLVIPALQSIGIAENGDETLRPLKYILDKLEPEAEPGNTNNIQRLKSIKEVTYNFDHEAARRYPRTNHNLFWRPLLLPTIEALETSANDNSEATRTIPHFHPLPFQPSSPLTSLTSLVIRHTLNISEILRCILPETVQLRSLTCETFRDTSQKPFDARPQAPWIFLDQWNTELSAVQRTLEILVLSVELSNEDCTYFNQPNLKPHVQGRLNLQGFESLHTLEVPVPFLTDDAFLWIGSDTNFLPFAPPNLRHLTLRTDMTDAQFVYPWDTSIRATGPTFQESKEEARIRDQARMDLTCIFQIALTLVDQLPDLHSFAVWQPPDPSLDMFDYQLEDLRTSCKNNSITARVIYPMLLRWKSPAHWNLIRELTLFDKHYPESGSFARLFRGDRRGMPLGLASQYHLNEYRKHHVRTHR